MKNRSNVLTAAVALMAATVLAACGSTSSSTTSASSDAAASGVTASDPWVKSAPDGMTAAFVTLSNPTDTEQVLVSATTPVSPMVQLHEMVMQDGQMVMQEKKGGIAVPAKGSAVLEPGGNHIMLMGLTSAGEGRRRGAADAHLRLRPHAGDHRGGQGLHRRGGVLQPVAVDVRDVTRPPS